MFRQLSQKHGESGCCCIGGICGNCGNCWNCPNGKGDAKTRLISSKDYFVLLLPMSLSTCTVLSLPLQKFVGIAAACVPLPSGTPALSPLRWTSLCAFGHCL